MHIYARKKKWLHAYPARILFPKLSWKIHIIQIYYNLLIFSCLVVRLFRIVERQNSVFCFMLEKNFGGWKTIYLQPLNNKCQNIVSTINATTINKIRKKKKVFIMCFYKYTYYITYINNIFALPDDKSLPGNRKGARK